MSRELIVNPYLQFQPVGDGSEEILLRGPKKGSGFQTINVSKTSYPGIFEAFSDLAQSSFEYLEPEKDLSNDERSFLNDRGMLGHPDSFPKLPSFACPLDDVHPGNLSYDRQTLRVNNSFRFEPFDLTKFAAKLRGAHLSPTRPSAWVKSLGFEIEMGYWLEPDQADVLSRLVPGAAVGFDFDNKLVDQLVAAEILVDHHLSKRIVKDRNNQIIAARDAFAASGYALVPSLLPPHQMESYRRFYLDYVNEGFMPLGDEQVPNRYREHNEPLAAFLHKTLQPLMSRIAGKEVIPSYVYAASYKDGASLAPHTDRRQCEFSISFQVDYLPEPEGHVSPWALCVEPLGDKQKEEIGWNNVDPDAARSFYLASGDGLFYKGCELIHYRHALPEGHRSTSLFFHFVPSDFDGSLE